MAEDEEGTEEKGIRITIERLIGAQAGMAAIASQQYGLKLGFKIATLKAAIDAPYDRYERSRIATLRDLATKDDAGNPIELEIERKFAMDPAVERQFNADLLKLLQEEVVITAKPLRASDFPKDAKVVPAWLVQLGPFFVQDT